MNLDHQNRQVVLKPVELPLTVSGVDEKFTLQVAKFDEEYRLALEALAGEP